MPQMKLVDAIRQAVAAGRWGLSSHAKKRIEQRGIVSWQLEAGLEGGSVTDVRPTDEPNPSIEVEQELADGTRVNVAWSYVILYDEALVVTAHFFD